MFRYVVVVDVKQVKRFAPMHRSDGIFKLRNLFRIWHRRLFEFCVSDACPLLAPLRLVLPFLTRSTETTERSSRKKLNGD
jgi:hypothetical protein